MLYCNAFKILEERYGLDYVESILPFPLKIVVGCAQIDSEIYADHNVFLTYKNNDFDFDYEKDYTFSFYIGNELVVDGQMPYGQTLGICNICTIVSDIYKKEVIAVEVKNQEKIFELERKNAFFFLSIYFAVYKNKDLFLHYLKKASFNNPRFMRELICEYKNGNKKQRLMGRKLNYNLVNKKHKKK